MKKLLLTTVLAASTAALSAQHADGTIFPDFTATDVNLGYTHSLYSDYLDQGYTVVIDVSAAWCGPCWSYHQTGALDDLFYNHGPAGMTGVSASTTDDVMVIYIEGQTTNTMDQLNGIQGSTGNAYADQTQGDWISGTLFPIIDANASLMQLTGISYFPTIYTIYPDRTLEESGTMSATNHYTNIQNNLPDHQAATGGVDADVLLYQGETATCSDLEMDIRVQNKGDQTLAAGATVEILDGTTVIGSGTTTTALDQFDVETVTITVSISANTTLTAQVTASGDVNTSNGSQSIAVSLADETNYSAVTVEIATDAYGSETTWNLKNGSGATVASGGPYSDQSSAGAYPQTSVYATLDPNDCYTLTVNDSYGDGMDAGYGTGYVRVVDGGGTTLISVGDFADVATGNFKSGDNSSVSVEENVLTNMSVYPNPFSNIATISFENGSAVETEIKVTNMVGQIVVNEFLGEVVGTQVYELNGNNLEAGIYMVTVKAGNKTTTQRVVLSK